MIQAKAKNAIGMGIGGTFFAFIHCLFLPIIEQLAECHLCSSAQLLQKCHSWAPAYLANVTRFASIRDL